MPYPSALVKHLKSLTKGPPGGWRILEPSTGYVAMGVTFMQALGKLAQHRVNMQIPDDPMWRLDEIAEDRICNALSASDQLIYCVTGVRKRDAVGWREVMTFLKTVVLWLAGGLGFVEQEEAERRAAICANCPLNVGMGGCAPCKVTVDAFRTQMFKLSTSLDSKLRACGVCGCENKVSVHLPLDALQKGKAHLTFPDFCWQFQSKPE